MKYPLLRELIRVMKDVADSGLPLEMGYYYAGMVKDFKDSTTIHTCGTAACIAGYGALDPQVMTLAEKIEAPKFIATGGLSPAHYAEGVYMALQTELGVRFANSICTTKPQFRREGFLLGCSIEDDLKTIRDMRHITVGFGDEPEYAVEYMESLLELLEARDHA